MNRKFVKGRRRKNGSTFMYRPGYLFKKKISSII